MASILSVLNGQTGGAIPIWLMRQAGRYLPEYRQVRAEAGGFLDLCYNPEFATEVTLQPILRFGFDAAILFSDILVVPHALGQAVWFETGEGPRLEPISGIDMLRDYDRAAFLSHLEPPLETIGCLRKALPEGTPLIGFCGAPWTVASYMVAGRGTPDLAPVRDLAASRPAALQGIIDRLVTASVDYLTAQIDAGAQIIQIFESWAQVLADGDFDRWSLEPLSRIVTALKAHAPDVPVIVFPRKSGDGYLKVAKLDGVSAVSIDPDVDLDWIATHVQTRCAVQGNVDPNAMVAGPEAIDTALEPLFRTLAEGPWIANLGHGILPQTPIEHVEYLVRRVRDFRA